MYSLNFVSTKTFFREIVELLILVCLRAAPAEARRAPLRTIGGRDARPGEFPYVVRLEIEDPEYIDSLTPQHRTFLLCTASVLTPTTTLTAAHCDDDSHVVVRYGSEDGRPSKNDKFSNVLDWFVTPSARTMVDALMKGDLALLRTEPIVLRSYARLSARDHHTMYGQRVVILGYGITNHSTGIVLYDTLELDMPLQVVGAMLSPCHDYNKLFHETHSYPYVCAVERCGRHAEVCGGDSGGPVLHASGVVGITSAGPHHACQMLTDHVRTNVIDIIIPLSSDMDWIADIVAKMGST